MPMKKGAHGKLRHYNSRTGRYEKEQIIPQTRKLSQKEKELLRQENLRNRAINSKDKLLPSVYSELEKAIPGCIIDVNKIVYDKNIKGTREIDLETKKYIIEVKSGIATHCATQFLNQIKYAQSIGKKAIVYAPNILLATEADYKRKGIRVVKSIYELKKIIKGD